MEIIPYIVDLLIGIVAIFVIVLFISFLKNKFKKEPEPALKTVKIINRRKSTSSRHRHHSRSHTRTSDRRFDTKSSYSSRSSKRDTKTHRSEKDEGYDIIREINNKKRKGRFEVLNDPKRKWD